MTERELRETSALSDHKELTRRQSIEDVRNNSPWAFEPNQDMIVGDDIDAFMSACFLHHLLGWNIKGFYVGYNTLYFNRALETNGAWRGPFLLIWTSPKMTSAA